MSIVEAEHPAGVPVSVSVEIGGKEISFETGKLAKQADGAVIVRSGDTVVLGTAQGRTEAREGADFFPLTVDVEEREGQRRREGLRDRCDPKPRRLVTAERGRLDLASDRDAERQRGHVPGEYRGLSYLQKQRIQHEFATLLPDPVSAVRVFLRGGPGPG